MCRIYFVREPVLSRDDDFWPRTAYQGLPGSAMGVVNDFCLVIYVVLLVSYDSA